MFKNFRQAKKQLIQAKEQLATINHYFDFAVDHIEENKNVYVAAGLGAVGGFIVCGALRGRPVQVTTTVNLVLPNPTS